MGNAPFDIIVTRLDQEGNEHTVSYPGPGVRFYVEGSGSLHIVREDESLGCDIAVFARGYWGTVELVEAE